jgi:EAL domain-containing protein (putative c-di-GMP-specific phosphodiesterase class I)/CheY-like chemotaxis protein
MINENLSSNQNKSVILIVDDQKINCAILNAILSKDYDVLEAHNGKEALDLLDEKKVNAILLDLVMPIMDGFTFLEEVRKTSHTNIPVIALTSERDPENEQRALELGAWDYVQKPYQPIILLTRLKNVLIRSQYYLLNEMRYIYEHDTLTGLYNRSSYFTAVRELLDHNPLKTFVMVRFDIKGFQGYNSFWGEEEGDRLLKYMSGLLLEQTKYDGNIVCARISADVFSITLPYQHDKLINSVPYFIAKLADFNKEYVITPVFGFYVISDPNEDTQNMYEKTTLAGKTCKSLGSANYLFYEPKMSEKMKEDQWVVNEMQSALNNGEFEFFLQPKFNLINKDLVGSEALIRWRNKERGLLPPGVFIPVLEKNGFIGKVDFFVWDGVCKLLRKWLDNGIKPKPISVNVSRVDFYNPSLVNILIGLVKKYDIPIDLFELEVTESAYMEAPETMERCVKALQEKGFTILMDDFGSGYSSLNTLKDIHVDILKIDMKFLDDNLNSERSKQILKSVVALAQNLKTPVIIEGVETENQVEFLKGVGCVYGQGYYYSKPIEVTKFEELMNK